MCDCKNKKPDIYEICRGVNYGDYCKDVMSIFEDGLTNGVFQLEKHLGHVWSKKLKPESINDIAALIALLRPGCLHANIDGKSITQKYVDRKHGYETPEPFHESIADVLSDTYGLMCYQEQTIKIAVKLAGFDEQKSDDLRYAIGKKIPEKMREIKKDFIDGCANVGIVSRDEAEEIFSWIQESQRYSFNASHSYAYGIITYLTAWMKYHFPLEFYASWIKWSRFKMNPREEMANLIREARSVGISICPPNIDILPKSGGDVFIEDNTIYLPMSCVKGIGESVLKKIVKIVSSHKINTWVELVLYLLFNVGSSVVDSLISCGACDKYMDSRKKMMYEYSILSGLTKREISHVRKLVENGRIFKNSLDILGEARNIANRKRAETIVELEHAIQEPPYSLVDNPGWRFREEKSVYGTPLTVNISSMIGKEEAIRCSDFSSVPNQETFTIGGVICNSRTWKAKSGKNKGKRIAGFSLEDETGVTGKLLVMNEEYKKFKDVICDDNTVVVVATKGKNGDVAFVKEISQI